MKFNICYGDESDLMELESKYRGYRNDVTVVIGKRNYPVYITDIIRLHQDFDTEIEDSGYYLNMPNIIIVKEVTKAEIEKTVELLYNERFFERLGYKRSDK
jgi:hypothetical protein